MNINYNELVTNKNINTIDSNTNLQGVSEFQYFNTQNNFEKNNNNENNENNSEMSSLAKAGKNIIELTGENELIPINQNINDNNIKGIDINELDLMNEERKNEENNDKKGIIQFKKEIERNNLLYNDLDKPFTMEDLYNDKYY